MFATTSLHSWSASTASALPLSPRGSTRDDSTLTRPASELVADLTYDSSGGDASLTSAVISTGAGATSAGAISEVGVGAGDIVAVGVAVPVVSAETAVGSGAAHPARRSTASNGKAKRFMVPPKLIREAYRE